MKVLTGRNVNYLLPQGMNSLLQMGGYISPRGLSTLEYPGQVVSIYERPTERVLFDPVRDANPFFHFMEGLWIIGGRQDVEFVSEFNSRIKDYSDDGVKFHGAYGHRLRNKFDQVGKAIEMLRKDPDTRRVVLQIWDAKRDLGADVKDVPCNDLIILKVRECALHMTVCCRSNDAIWGCYGANVVHFSMLQEYMASMIGVNVGEYVQISDSFHVYNDNPYWKKVKENIGLVGELEEDPYSSRIVSPWPMVQDPETWDRELYCFLNQHTCNYKNSFFTQVAIPIHLAWMSHKHDNSGHLFVSDIAASDWRMACHEWLERRGDHV